MLTLCAVLLASTPTVESKVESVENRRLSFTAALTGTWGQSPGNPFSLNAGVRYRWARFSLGLEAQPLMPGSVSVLAKDLEAFGVGKPILPSDLVVAEVRGVGFIGRLPVCAEWGALSTCAVAAVGALSLNGSALQPMVSAGGRVAGEFPRDSSVRFRASAELLGGIIRPAAGTFWQTNPVQFGLTAGLVADAL